MREILSLELKYCISKREWSQISTFDLTETYTTYKEPQLKINPVEIKLCRPDKIKQYSTFQKVI